MRITNISDNIRMVQVSPLDSNMYVINGGALVIDTTTGHHESLLGKAFSVMDLKFEDIESILNTHTHIDHIGGNHLFRNAKVMMHESARYALSEPTLKNTLSRYFKITPKDLKISIPLKDGDTIRAKGTKFVIIHTPGHSKDSICVYMPDEEILFTGDSLPVRMDKKISYYIKNREVERESLGKIKSLPIHKILPGHGDIIEDKERIKELLHE